MGCMHSNSIDEPPKSSDKNSNKSIQYSNQPNQSSQSSQRSNKSTSSKQSQYDVSKKRASQHLTENIVTENVNRDIRDFYTIDNTELLGTGVNGSVRVCIHLKTDIKYAYKILNKKHIKKEKLDQLREEIQIMSQLDHPNILRLHEYFENNDAIYLVMERCLGGELLDRLHEQKGHHYSEIVACKYINTMVRAINYCHSHKIVHRDLKLENFLFESKSIDSELKLIDFGLSQHFEPNVLLHKSVGTPYYVSPEVLAGNYDAKCDVWSIGVIAYMLLSGTPPFYGKDDNETLQSVKIGKWKFHESLFKPISNHAKDFIRCCLTRNPLKRMSSSQLLEHPWFNLLTVPQPEKSISLDVISRLRGFEKRSGFVKLCMEVLAYTLHAEQISELRKEFIKFDIKQSGEITYEDFKNILIATTKLNEKDLNMIINNIDIGHTGVIHYHEFIAATLSRRMITDDNARVAFEKISKHREYITADDIKDLMGVDANTEDIELMLEEASLPRNAKISFDEFKAIMLGGPATPNLLSPASISPAINRKKFDFFIGNDEGSQRSVDDLTAIPSGDTPAATTGWYKKDSRKSFDQTRKADNV